MAPPAMSSPSSSSTKAVTLQRNGAGYLFALIFLSLSLLGLYMIRVVAIQSGVSEKMEYIGLHGKFVEHDDMPLRTEYTGIAQLDKGLSFLVAAFMNGAAGWDQGFTLLLFYFLVSFFPVVAIWAVESCRVRNRFALTRFTGVFALFYQTVGGAIIIPLYHLIYMRDTSRRSDPTYWSAASRRVPVSYAKALLPAVVLGYLVPTALIFLPYSAPHLWTTQAAVALWQPCPWFVDGLLWLLASLLSVSSSPQTTTPVGRGPKGRKKTAPPDLAYLDTLYAVAFTVAAFAHVASMLTCLLSANSAQLSFAHVFLIQSGGGELSMTQGMHAIFQADFWIIFASSLIWAFVAAWDLKRLGKTDVSLATVFVAILVGSVLVGPAATLAGVWHWREHVMVAEEMA